VDVKEKVKVSWSMQGRYARVLEGKGKAVPLQAWNDPEVSGKLRVPDFITTAQDGGRLSALRTDILYLQEMLLVLVSFRG